MRRPPSAVDQQLEASLSRISDAIERNRRHYAAAVEQVVAEASAEVAAAVEEVVAETRAEVAAAGRVTARIAGPREHRLERRRRRDDRRPGSQPDDGADLPRAFVSAAAAIVCLALAFLRPGLWWLVFVAFGLGTDAASAFGRSARRRQAEREAKEDAREAASVQTGKDEVLHDRPATPAHTRERQEAEATPSPAPEPPDPRVTRIQILCDKLLAELESGPPIVREVVTEPQATIGGLRQACLEIARRERELRSVLAAQDEAALVAERDALVARLSNEEDDIVRDRLSQALHALEQQLTHRAELTTAAARLEAENTRILYTLESLHMQLLRARSTDVGAPELGGKLRHSLRELGTEIDAVAEALEWASAPGDAATPPGRAPTVDTGSTQADAERAERQEAARRAARAREAERH